MMHWHPLVDEFLPTLIALRRQIHRHPELGFQEHRTAALIASTLTALGISPCSGVAGTGVTAVLAGQAGPTVAIRADMDALPIQEQNAVPYASTVPNVMHACGHDGHVATVLGAAMVLSKLAPLPGTVKFIFQPAEEGPGGARPMIEAGVLQHPAVEAIFGLHLTNALPVGRIGVCYGQTCAATDEIKITVLGKGGHGAHPHQAVDAIVAAAQVVASLQTIASRQVDPLESVVVTIGTIAGGYANNVIADKVELHGTVRTLNEAVRTAMPEKIERIVRNVSAAYGADCRFEYLHGYPSLVNDQALTGLLESSAVKAIGRDNVVPYPPSMGGEDFAYFARAVPATFFRLGSGSAICTHPGHHPRFDFAEEALGVGATVLVQAVLDYFRV